MIIVVRNCPDCPFVIEEADMYRCRVSQPPKRPMEKDQEARPSFCPLMREQVIVRQFD